MYKMRLYLLDTYKNVPWKERKMNPDNPLVIARQKIDKDEWIDDVTIKRIYTEMKPNEDNPPVLRFETLISAAKNISMDDLTKQKAMTNLHARACLFVCKLITHVLIQNTEFAEWNGDKPASYHTYLNGEQLVWRRLPPCANAEDNRVGDLEMEVQPEPLLSGT